MTALFSKYRYFWIGLGIFLLNFVLKLWYITTPEIGTDETFTIFNAYADLDTFFEILPYENNPPLFTLILKGWVTVFGIEPFSVRFLPTLFSALSAVVLFQLARRFFNTDIAWIATGIFTFASTHYFFAHETRPYALFVLLTLLSMYAYLRLLIDDSKKHRYWLALFNVLLIYNHFFGFLVIFIQALVFALDKSARTRHWKSVVISWGITALLFTPYLPMLFHRFVSSSGGTWLAPPDATGLYTELWRFSNQPVNTVIFIALLVVAAVFFLVRKPQMPTLPTRLVLVWFLLCYFGMFALSFKLPIFLDRYLVFLSPAFYLLVALSVHSIIRNKLAQRIVGAALVLMMAFTANYAAGNLKKQGDLLSHLITPEEKAEKIVVVSPDSYHWPIAYYHNREIFKDAKHMRQRLEDEGFRIMERMTPELEAELRTKKEVIFVDAWAELVDPEETIHHFLEANMRATKVIDDGKGLTITYYVWN